MTPEEPSLQPRYLTLHDYLRVLRRYALLIVALGVIGAAAGLIDALRQTAVYQASAEVSFSDPTQGLGLVGLNSTGGLAPAQIAAQYADTATAPAVLDAAAARLHTPGGAPGLAGSVSASVAVPSGLLQLSASSSDPQYAARLANAVAGVIVAQDNRAARRQFARLSADLQGQISRLTRAGARSPAAAQLAFDEDELARLQTLGAFTNAAQLARPATVPSSPISPHKTRSILLGLAIGLLLGVLAAFFRDALDRRLRSASDFETALNLRSLGQIRKRALGSPPPQPGANGGRSEDVEAFRIIRRNLELLDPERPPRCIAVTSGLPEEGKTTVAAALAASFAAGGRRTALIDCDLRRPALALRLRSKAAPGLTDLLEGRLEPQEAMRPVDPLGRRNGAAPTNGARQLDFIPSGTRNEHPGEMLASPRFGEILQRLSETHDVVILDTSPLLPVADTLEVLGHVDAVVLCAREGRSTREDAQATRAALERFPGLRVGLVATGVDDRTPSYAYAYAGNRD